MTLEEKLEKFKSGTHVLHAPTKGLWNKLMVELDKRGYKWLPDTATTPMVQHGKLSWLHMNPKGTLEKKLLCNLR